LEALGRREQLGIDRRRANGTANLTHRFANGIEEGSTGVLHQMPAIRDLHGVRQGFGCRFAISPAAIAGDNADRRVSSEPSLCSRWLTIG
jgi:hypothetical protein